MTMAYLDFDIHEHKVHVLITNLNSVLTCSADGTVLFRTLRRGL